MATQFPHDCPHCLSTAAGFTCTYQWQDRSFNYRAFVLAVCGICNNGLILRVDRRSQQQIPSLPGSNLNFPSSDIQLVETWPTTRLDKPSDVPDHIDNFYTQGLVNLRGRRWDAAGAMFRKTLDVSTKLIEPEHRAENLFIRIEKLVAAGHLTKAMGEWSHEIRIEGNDAVHDEKPETEADANAIQKFTEAFLRYAFTLPNMVEQNRSKRRNEDS